MLERFVYCLAVVALTACSVEETGTSSSGGAGGAQTGGSGGAGGSSGAGGSGGVGGGAGLGGGGGAGGSAGGSGGVAGSGASGGVAGAGGTAATGGAGGAGGTGGTAPIIDATTLTKKLMFGYQGWFLCPGDGSPPNRWVHWFKSQTPAASELTVDMWPDTSELDADELFDTQLTYAGNKKAQLYSAYPQKTVVRHFKWMKDAGIDGVFLQRFLSELSDPKFLAFRDQVAQNARAGAEAHGRTFVMMYDISGASASTFVDDIKKDWAHLVDGLKVTASDRYLKHKGKPLLAIWGLGFTDRPGSAAEASALISWFKSGAPANQQVTLMGGVPTNWRTLNSDSKTDPAWAAVYTSFDVVSPWAVGRYADNAGADNFKQNKIAPDLLVTKAKGIDYLPVVFPGFSWKNLNGGALNQIPRKGGAFWWRQVYNAIGAGNDMLYGAMFDEVDEGTAMFKLAATAADAPAQGSFVTLDADGQKLPSDWYLRVAGAGSQMLRGEIALTPTLPISP
ncbi:MAG: xylosidase/arabinosidase [Myxococcales bacterium]|nr:xylosidase/arabinosidase [Myxococcales bacterium]